MANVNTNEQIGVDPMDWNFETQFLRDNTVIRPLHHSTVISAENPYGNFMNFENLAVQSVQAWQHDKVFLKPANLCSDSPAVRLQIMQMGHLVRAYLCSLGHDFKAIVYVNGAPHKSQGEDRAHVRFDVIFENEVGTEPEDEIGSATMHIWYDWDDSKQTYKDSNRIGSPAWNELAWITFSWMDGKFPVKFNFDEARS